MKRGHKSSVDGVCGGDEGEARGSQVESGRERRQGNSQERCVSFDAAIASHHQGVDEGSAAVGGEASGEAWERRQGGDGSLGSLWAFLYGQVWHGYYDTGEEEVMHQSERKRRRVYNFFRVPIDLEKFLSFGFFVCFDAFLFLFTLLPVRFTLAVVRWGLWRVGAPVAGLSFEQRIDMLRGSLLVLCWLGLGWFDASWIYHKVRGQAVIKLYVIFNCMEIFERLIASVGQDIMDTLYASVTERRPRLRRMFWVAYGVAMGSTLVHAAILFSLVISINVAFNSFNNALVTLLVSNQFVELKRSVFKRFRKDNLFKISCSDVVERFHIFVFMIIISAQNMGQLPEVTYSAFMANTGISVVMFTISEVFVDFLKHAFITKFNRIPPRVYRQFTNILCRDLIHARRRRYLPSHHNVEHRLGFVSIPLAALFLRTVIRVIPIPLETKSIVVHVPDLFALVSGDASLSWIPWTVSWYRWSWAWFGVVGIAYLNLLALKICINICIVARASRLMQEWDAAVPTPAAQDLADASSPSPPATPAAPILQTDAGAGTDAGAAGVRASSASPLLRAPCNVSASVVDVGVARQEDSEEDSLEMLLDFVGAIDRAQFGGGSGIHDDDSSDFFSSDD